MAGRLQKNAFATIALWAFSGAALADDPKGLAGRVLDGLPMGARWGLFAASSAAEGHAAAGATVRAGRGWRASLFVRHVATPPELEEVLVLRSSTTVGAQLAGKLDRRTRLTVDVFNVFDQRGGPVDYFTTARIPSYRGSLDGYLFHPGEGRGLRITVSRGF